MITKTYTCDDCGKRGIFTSYMKARAANWAIAKDYSSCYCPECAPAHRRGKAAEKNYLSIPALSDDFKQLKIKEIVK